MKNKLSIFLVLIISISSYSQSLFPDSYESYISENDTLKFMVSQYDDFVEFSHQGLTNNKLQLSDDRISYLEFEGGGNYAVLHFEQKLINQPGGGQSMKEYPDTISVYGAIEESNVSIVRKEPVLIFKDGTRQVCTNEIILKLRSNTNLDSLLGETNYESIPDEFIENLFLLKFESKSTSQIFKIVTDLGRKEVVEYAEPNFIRLMQPNSVDPLRKSQWSIKNDAYLNGNKDADMDVDEAWKYSKGKGIKIAIIDEGVDLKHPDLINNLLPGYDATGYLSKGAPDSANNDAHGTSCAGIVAATGNNKIGITGIAYKAKIIPIRVAYGDKSKKKKTWITKDFWLSQGIKWGAKEGADILSNSWGGGSPSRDIKNAIKYAQKNGRKGKGCVVLFASGNHGKKVEFPANLENVIAVGASNMCDKRKGWSSCDNEKDWSSNYGDKIDVVAPGVKVYTTDISGKNGYEKGDYVSDFNGTSSACPNAAGVAALVLSANPKLTYKQVRQILETTTDKVTGYTYKSYFSRKNGTWNNEVGYGRLNALAAVKKAKELR